MSKCMSLLFAGAVLPLTGTFAHGQAYPTKPVRLVATSPPGGSQDFLARLLAQNLSPLLGQQMIVENRTGASGAIGIEHVAKAAPDGYTLLLGAAGPLTLVPVFNSRLPFDPVRDFAPITLLASGPLEQLSPADRTLCFRREWTTHRRKSFCPTSSTSRDLERVLP